jgi:uncharacterized membrane protein
MNSKGQEVSITVIIVAAIALLVLVVLSIIFLGRAGIFSQKTVDCEGQGGQCVVGPCPAGIGEYNVWACPKTSAGATQTCCALPK